MLDETHHHRNSEYQSASLVLPSILVTLHHFDRTKMKGGALLVAFTLFPELLTLVQGALGYGTRSIGCTPPDTIDGKLMPDSK